MKRIKIAFASLAVLFAVTTSFTVTKHIKVGDRTESLQWFEYNGGTKTLESAWTYRTAEPSGCNNTQAPCSIQILADDVTHDINDTKFANLKGSTQTNDFVTNGDFQDGKFREKVLE